MSAKRNHEQHHSVLAVICRPAADLPALCAVMLKMAWGRCIELGISQEKIKGVIKSSVIFSIVPSLSIVIGLFSLAAVLGVPWPWFRLSVVGSGQLGADAADMVATGAGYESIGALQPPTMLRRRARLCFVMSIGIMFGIVTCTFFGKKIQTSMTSFREKNGAWGALATGCFTLALMVVFLPVPGIQGPHLYADPGCIRSGYISARRYYQKDRLDLAFQLCAGGFAGTGNGCLGILCQSACVRG